MLSLHRLLYDLSSLQSSVSSCASSLTSFFPFSSLSLILLFSLSLFFSRLFSFRYFRICCDSDSRLQDINKVTSKSWTTVAYVYCDILLFISYSTFCRILYSSRLSWLIHRNLELRSFCVFIEWFIPNDSRPVELIWWRDCWLRILHPFQTPTVQWLLLRWTDWHSRLCWHSWGTPSTPLMHPIQTWSN